MAPIGNSIDNIKLEYLSKFLTEYTAKNKLILIAKVKKLLTEHNVNVNKRYIKPTYNNKEGEYYKICNKVALPTVPVNDAFVLITNEEGIYINNIDFTQDFASVINKGEFIQYLIENNNYVIEKYNASGDYVIMDNDKLVWKDCFTFPHNIEHGLVRYKFYIKFIQSIELAIKNWLIRAAKYIA